MSKLFFLTRVLLISVLLLSAMKGNTQIFWSEDFTTPTASLPAGWIVFDNNAGGGLWEVTNQGPTGPFPTDPCGETGTDNHWIMFDSDADCSGDQDAWIQSPPIDCTNKEIVWLAFDQCYRNFYCETYIRITTDDTTPLNDWEEIQINFTTLNQFGPPEILLDITAYAALQPTVYIAFEFRNVAGQSPNPATDGCAYNWQVDNIALYDQNPIAQFDLAVSNNFYAIAPNALWPASQIEPFGFLTDVANNGQSDQSHVKVQVDIIHAATNNMVHTDLLDFSDIGFPTIAAGTIIENQLFSGDGFTPPAEEATYIGQYQIFSDTTDALPLDNVASFDFTITNHTFAKEDTASISISPTTGLWPAGDPYSWAFGNHYYVPNGDGWKADKVSFALGNPGNVAGKQVTALLYKWDNINIGSPTSIAPADRTPIGYSEYLITGFEGNGNFITVELLDNQTNEPGVILEDDTHYLLMLSYAATDQSTIVAIAGSERKDYGAQIYRSEQLGLPRYAGILMIGELETGTWSTVGFGRDIVPAVRMHIVETEVSVLPVLPTDDIITLFPNPVKNQLYIHIELAEQAGEVAVVLMDSRGKTIQQQLFTQIQTQDLQFGLEDWPSGIYFLQVQTNRGQRSLPFVLQK
jgi:Secretion system C-terminal sorting domain